MNLAKPTFNKTKYFSLLGYFISFTAVVFVFISPIVGAAASRFFETVDPMMAGIFAALMLIMFFVGFVIPVVNLFTEQLKLKN